MRGIKWTNDDIQILQDMYESHSTLQIATMVNRSTKAVSCKLHKLGLCRDKKTYHLSENSLKPLQGLTINKIAEKLGVSRQIARTYIKRNNIKTSAIIWTPEEDKIIVDNYQNMFLKDLHKTFFSHIRYETLKAHKENMGLVKEDRGKLLIGYKVGKDSANWKGGIAFEPYCYKFNDALKEQIRNRFNRKCAMCGISESEYMDRMRNDGKRPCKLHVHHIGSDKKQGCDGVKINLAPLCASCHTKMHWTEGMEELLIKKLNILYNNE